jgi:hypothetical protein
LVALCCFTPILVILLGVVGLSALTWYLDYVLLPALADIHRPDYLCHMAQTQG